MLGDVITPIDFPTSLYFTALLIAMKLAGVEKPSKITLKIRNARDLFVNLNARRMSLQMLDQKTYQ
jgi:hypothetical protein